MREARSGCRCCHWGRRSKSTQWWRSAPRPDPRWPDWLTARPYAHRGLHGDGVVENSRAAFLAAIDKGFGIELDVRASRDGAPFVFHDSDLERLCGVDGHFDALDRAEVAALRLQDGDGEAIPTLGEALATVHGRAPLLLELKAKPQENMCREVLAALSRYQGPVALMSFDPRLVAWFARRAPELIRGLVVSEEGKSKFKGLIERRLALRLARPDFLAYDIRSLPSAFAAAFRKRGRPVLSWTVRTLGEARTAQLHADQIIHELADAL